MTSIPSSPFVSSDPRDAARSVFVVIGLACIFGFAFNILTAAMPPDPMALEWRVGLMQQVSGRAILLFLGVAMVLYGILDQRRLAMRLAMVCLLGGILFLLSGVLVIRDGIVLQNQTLGNIDSQLETLQSEIQAAQSSPDLPDGITPQRLDDELVQIEAQATNFKETARGTTAKSMVAILGSQVVVGLGLLSLGRFGINRSRST